MVGVVVLLCFSCSRCFVLWVSFGAFFGAVVLIFLLLVDGGCIALSCIGFLGPLILLYIYRLSLPVRWGWPGYSVCCWLC